VKLRDFPEEELFLQGSAACQGCPGSAAIRVAFGAARPGDMVLLLGKGHEGCIFYPDYALPWDEAAVAHQVLHEMGYGAAQDLESIPR